MAEMNFSSALSRLQADYMRLMWVDMHGQLRGKLFPARSVNPSGEPITISALTICANGYAAEIEEQVAIGFANIKLIPQLQLRVPPAKRRDHGAQIIVTLCEASHQDGTPVMEDCRWIARKQLERLADCGLTLFSGTEFEFRMYKAPKDGQTCGEPVSNDRQIFSCSNIEVYESFAIDLDGRLREMNIDMYNMHSECGRGQVEIPLLPAWGVNSADQSCLFKMVVRDTARDHGMLASFMTKDSFAEFSNGFHFNHSLWLKSKENDGEPRQNAFWDPERKRELSDLGRHWLGGLMHHGKALLAVCCPTVNCYRRVGQPWSPTTIDWGFDNRFAAFRVKVDGASGTYIENRLPSSASNPYIVLAATVAAGLDGLERKLEPPAEMDSILGRFPVSLEAALEALAEDEILKNAFGQRFMSWFAKVKESEIEDLKGIDVSQNREKDLEREKTLYQFFI